MALILCRKCGNMVSDRAAACPKCGAPVNTEVTVMQYSKPAPVSPSSTPSTPHVSNIPDTPSKSSSNTGLYAIIGLLVLAVLGLGIYALSGRDNGANNQGEAESETLASEEMAVEAVDSAAVDVAENNSSDFNCHSEELFTEDAPDNGVVVDGRSATINNTWLEHDVDGGIKIHVDMSTSNLLNRNVEVTCFFWFEDGRKVKSTDGKYESPDRQVCTSRVITANYQECTWNDLQLWIPYRQIKSVRDYKHLKCRVHVFYNNTCLATGNYMHFGCWLE